MKIEIEASDISFKYETPQNLTAEQLIEVARRIIDSSDNAEPVVSKVIPMKPIQQVQEVKAPVERPPFRDRLPNNIVDVNELDVKQATQGAALVRCPHCGQSHCIVLRDGANMYMMQKRDGEFKIIIGPVHPTDFLNRYVMPEESNPLDYYNDLLGINIQEDKDFAVDNDTDIFCPVCHQSAKFIEWKRAYDEPLSYFEYEHPCEVCGGETTVLKAAEDEEVIYGCEVCGHESK